MVVLTPPDADSLLLTGANDAQLFAYSVPHFQTVRLSKSCIPHVHQQGAASLDTIFLATAWPEPLQSGNKKTDRQK